MRKPFGSGYTHLPFGFEEEFKRLLAAYGIQEE
jgi:hypothetical protein